MDKFLYIAASGAKQDLLGTAVRANNLANAQTTGFKAQLEQAKKSKVELINQYSAEMTRLTVLIRNFLFKLILTSCSIVWIIPLSQSTLLGPCSHYKACTSWLQIRMLVLVISMYHQRTIRVTPASKVATHTLVSFTLMCSDLYQLPKKQHL